MKPEEIFEQVSLFLPKYLTPSQKQDLYSEMLRFPGTTQFYLHRPDLRDQLLQGDGWQGFIAINFHTGQRKDVSGVILSNSCDVSTDNSRSLPVNILFAPLVNLSQYEQLLLANGKSPAQVGSQFNEIRNQKVTSMFYLPRLSGVIEESIILLDDIHVHPLRDFLEVSHEPLFQLNQFAFYLFLIKLSIHFCRFQEGIQRFEDAA
jgi:hypothetical protein